MPRKRQIWHSKLPLANWKRRQHNLATLWDCQIHSGAVLLAWNRAVTLGQNVAFEGTFPNDPGVWTLGANWTIAANKATHAPGAVANLSHDGIVAVGKTYQVAFTITGRTAGDVTVKLGASGTTRSTNDTFTETITSTGADLDFTPSNGFDGSISVVTVKQTDIAASSAFPGAELLVDGGLEDWTTPTNLESWLETGDVSKESINVYGGNFSAKFNVVDTALVRIDQTITDFNQLGRVNIQFAVKSSVAGKRLGLVATGMATILSTGAIDWELIVAEREVGNGTVIFVQRNDAGTYILYVDTLSIRQANPLNGDMVGVNLGNQSWRPLGYSITCDGGTTYLDILSAEFNSILDPTEFNLRVWFQKDTWDTTERYFLSLIVDANNWIKMGGTTTAGQLVWEVRAGGTTEQVLHASGSPTSWQMMDIVVTGGVMKAFLNGLQIGSDQPVAGTYIGNHASMVIGAETDVPGKVHLGEISQVSHLSSLDQQGMLEEYRRGIGVR
jgi:hypothetical protein